LLEEGMIKHTSSIVDGELRRRCTLSGKVTFPGGLNFSLILTGMPSMYEKAATKTNF